MHGENLKLMCYMYS